MEIKVTEKGNFLVKTDEKIGFFNREGNFLRLSNKKEWNCVKEKLKNFNGNIKNLNLDVQGMLDVEEEPVKEIIEKKCSSNRSFTLIDLVKIWIN